MPLVNDHNCLFQTTRFLGARISGSDDGKQGRSFGVVTSRQHQRPASVTLRTTPPPKTTSQITTKHPEQLTSQSGSYTGIITDHRAS